MFGYTKRATLQIKNICSLPNFISDFLQLQLYILEVSNFVIYFNFEYKLNDDFKSKSLNLFIRICHDSYKNRIFLISIH